MSDIGRNIAKYRKAQSLTQNALCDRLHVTRQTVSSWETGRTLPDIQMLLSLAEALDVSVEQLIYGRDIKAESRDISPYKKLAVVSALAVAVCACALFLIRPQLRNSTWVNYHVFPELLYYSILRPMAFLSSAACFLSLLSLAADISIPNHKWRLLFLTAGICLLLLSAYFVLVVYSVVPGGAWAYDGWWLLFYKNPYLFILSGLFMFLGLNRRF